MVHAFLGLLPLSSKPPLGFIHTANLGTRGITYKTNNHVDVNLTDEYFYKKPDTATVDETIQMVHRIAGRYPGMDPQLKLFCPRDVRIFLEACFKDDMQIVDAAAQFPAKPSLQSILDGGVQLSSQ
uniref:Uncharacterized protein n=1 Tax=Chromera velia CCMP2878 TaxID=1169474 RepID=A0A0G4GEM2_9ALVE|eukprot:Cvel_4590.t1-p1 / transcript=Cvel_4590.t1 / gene=Cvel_4590 / organism=Chromera_velia_CCMP2878 / gene_product=hypothetical protein / transcript_product=hypothetical protein / location=Cvel_scaffold202:665-1846(-) / protein_length=125 / sequence_SO=supercontig / SO=protein_coding / is_pseudo=false